MIAAVRWMVLASMMLFGGGAAASLLTFSVTGGAFSDGGTFSGTVTLDAASGNPTDWNLAVAGGGGSFPARTYTPSNSTVSSGLFGGSQPTIILSATDEAFRQMRMTPVSALDGSNSSVNLDTVFVNGDVECFNCSPFRPITGGAFVLASVTPTVTLVSAAPNPSTVGVVTTVTVAVSGIAAFGAPTGTVTVLDNSSNPLCTVTLPGTTCTFTPAAAGTQNLLGQYDGDANYATALSNTLALDIAAAPPPPPTVAATPVPALDAPALALLALTIVALAALRTRRR